MDVPSIVWVPCALDWRIQQQLQAVMVVCSVHQVAAASIVCGESGEGPGEG